jgi:hypothetical protein
MECVDVELAEHLRVDRGEVQPHRALVLVV